MLIRGVSTLSKAQDAPLREAAQQGLSTDLPSVFKELECYVLKPGKQAYGINYSVIFRGVRVQRCERGVCKGAKKTCAKVRRLGEVLTA
jgi:hypothetical protein